MAANTILEFAVTDTGTNLLTDAAYAADAQRSIGHQPGNARSQLANKTQRQTSLVAAAVAQYIADRQLTDVGDTLTPAALATMLHTSIRNATIPTIAAGGTADAITATFFPALALLVDGQMVIVQHGAANATTTPTLNVNGLGASSIVKGNNLALAIGDICGADFWAIYVWDATLAKWVMNNPATGVTPRSGIVGSTVWVHGTAAPAGTVKENGALLNRVTFAALWAFAQASGNLAASDAAWQSGQFSPGDGATTFRIPDSRGYSVRAYDDGRGVDAGRVIGATQADQLLQHSHGVNDPLHSHFVNDPQHSHGVPHDALSSSSGANISGSGNAPGSSANTGDSATGITLNGSATGVTIQNSSGGTEVRVKNIAWLACMTF